ncbi:MAG: hypothetical protein F6K19_23140 [Cyanothece sp. SIO1E1]|nr:hypothetical protein [Cyanothece sp. SIO1E1]
MNNSKKLFFCFFVLFASPITILANALSAFAMPDSADVISYTDDQKENLPLIEREGSLTPAGIGNNLSNLRPEDKIVLQDPVHSWAILQLFDNGVEVDPQVYAIGYDRQTTSYSFPCKLINGSAFVAWSLNPGNGNGCSRIYVGEGGQRRKVPVSSAFHLFALKQLKNFIYASSPEDMKVYSKEDFLVNIVSTQRTIVQIKTVEGEASATVLDGSIKAISEAYPEGRLVQAGQKYIHNRKSGDGVIESVNRNDIYRSNPFRTFIDPRNWPQADASYVEEYRSSIPVFGTFGISGIRSLIPPNTVIGGRYCSNTLIRSGCGENKTSSSGEISQTAQEGYRRLIESELAKAGYTILGSDTSFFRDQAKPDSARFLIGGTITDARFDTLESENLFTSSSSWKTKGEITIRWEIFDQEIGAVIFDQESVGKSKVAGQEVLPALYEAASDSLRSVLENF